MSEVLPPEVAKWQYVEEKARAVLDAFGYREVRTAAVAPDGTLRPPGPSALGRTYLAHALWLREPVTRWYELGPVFRRVHQKVQQTSQLAGVAFGAPGPAIDAEVIAMLVGLVGEAGVPGAATSTTLAPAGDGGRAHQERVRGFLAGLQVRAGVSSRSADAPPPELTFTIAAEDVPLVQGGRADGLVRTLGGPPSPAFTFTLDLAALVEAVPDPAESFLSPPAAAIVAEGPRAADWALTASHHLRMAGVRLELAPGPAARTRARLLVIARDEDLARGRVVIEDLASGTREEIPEDELEATIRVRLD
jgi:histidyl-tRNA synthetase